MHSQYPASAPCPPPQGFPPPQGLPAPQGVPPPQMVVMTSQPGVVPVVLGQPMGTLPTPYQCPSCRAHIMTRVIMKSTMKTHLFALLLCVFGCWTCVFVPYCVDTCKNANHYCPYCKVYIGCSKH